MPTGAMGQNCIYDLNIEGLWHLEAHRIMDSYDCLIFHFPTHIHSVYKTLATPS